jgi:hypothetical protein
VFSRNRVNGSPVVGINTGTLYVVHPRLALDGGVQFGLTQDASAFSAFAGFSLAVGAPRRQASQVDRRGPGRRLTSTSAVPGRD